MPKLTHLIRLGAALARLALPLLLALRQRHMQGLRAGRLIRRMQAAVSSTC
jgi:hypothetical protein